MVWADDGSQSAYAALDPRKLAHNSHALLDGQRRAAAGFNERSVPDTLAYEFACRTDLTEGESSLNSLNARVRLR